MGIFSKPKNKKQLALVFDIGSSSVGGVAFYMRENEAPEIIYSIREPIPFEQEVVFEKFFASTMKSLDVVVTKICMKSLGCPKKIFCVLSSPWYASQTRVINLEKDVPFTFTTKLADSLIQKEIDIFKRDHLSKYVDEEITPIELKNMKVVLNGYTAMSPLNQKAKDLEMTLFISMSPEQVLSRIKESINRHFHHQDIKFSSFAMATFSVARDMFVSQENFLLVDVGGEVTDIAMVKKDILNDSISFPIGRNYMIRGVASALNCGLTEAKSYISMYKDNHMEESISKKFEPIINKLKTDWLAMFQESLANLSNDISIPSTIFLTVDNDLVHFFSEIIRNEQFNQYTLTESKFRIIFLGTEALHGIVLFKEDIIRDPFLIIESIYANRFLNLVNIKS